MESQCDVAAPCARMLRVGTLAAAAGAPGPRLTTCSVQPRGRSAAQAPPLAMSGICSGIGLPRPFNPRQHPANVDRCRGARFRALPSQDGRRPAKRHRDGALAPLGWGFWAVGVWTLNLPTVAWPQLHSVMESMMHDNMRRMCAGLRTFLLLAIALTVAAHPVARSLPPHVSPNLAQAELQVVICTAHGAVVVDEPLGVPQPTKENPSCSWCAVAGAGALKLAALAPAEFCVFDPLEHQRHRLRIARSILPATFADWPAHAPRGPPRA